jgi:uncharacterized membrane protein HdeD (DUF308 family)
MNELIAGAMTMAYFVAGLFFLRFWARSRDTLFMYFAVAFWILAVQRLAVSFENEQQEDKVIFYVLRLLAFVLIIVAIWQKNRSVKKDS